MAKAVKLAVKPHLKLSSESLSYLASVLAELTREEASDFDSVRVLVEPFLLDARKQGRDRPHDKKSDACVDAMCRSVFERMQELLSGAPASHPVSICEKEAVPCMPAQDLAVGTRTVDTLRSVLQSFDTDIMVPDNVLEHLAVVLSDLSLAELQDTSQIAMLLESVLLDAFHDCGKWAATEDSEHLQTLSKSISTELLKARASASS